MSAHRPEAPRPWPGLEPWQRLWHAIGASGGAAAWHALLRCAYAEPHRHYHDERHIADCLAEFAVVRALARQPEAVEVALWFHDAVYDPKATDNEERSAALAGRCLSEAGRPGLGQTVAALVMATKLHRTDADPDAALVADVDLSILGQSEARFAEYESQIRAEYAWVPAEVFAAKRAEILRRFLDRPRVYATEPFFTRYERQARENLAQSLRILTQSGQPQGRTS
jgi:predicted metal-dependent HD superfamily phosphohydrolase